MTISDQLPVCATTEELAHDLASPVAFLRGLFEAMARGRELSDEDRDIARDEMDRLGRLLQALRATPALPRGAEALQLSAVVTRARHVLAADPTVPPRTVIDGVRPGHGFRAHPEVAFDLVRRALLWALMGARTEVRIASRHEGSAVALELTWDGPAPVPSPRARPWTVSGSELDILLLRRAARGLGGTVRVTSASEDASTLTLSWEAPTSEP